MISDYERKIRTRQAEGHYKHIWAELTEIWKQMGDV